MTVQALIFHTLAVVVTVATALAITRRQVVHAIVYLVVSFLATALLFYQLGAPLLAALEVIIYAGAIMVLFLFVVMMIDTEPNGGASEQHARAWAPAVTLAAAVLTLAALLILADSAGRQVLVSALASPADFGLYLFQSHGLAVEIASLLLFVALAGALYLGRQDDGEGGPAAGGEGS
jgi:NADH-quinone oxidoreductase subunit J